jgi:hypothetical protein
MRANPAAPSADLVADWDSLREAHPREDRVYRRDPPVRWACTFGTSMPRAIYADVPADDVVMANQLDPRRVSFLDGVQRGLRNRAAR